MGASTGSFSSGGRLAEEIMPLLYDELRRIARYHMSRERSSHTLQPTALVHEAYIKLLDQRKIDWENRPHVLGLASEIMRRLLVNHARDRRAEKRCGELQQVSITVAADVAGRQDVDILALNDSLDDLAGFDERKSKIVEMKFFGGLTTAEIGEVLGISVATVEREWSFAKAWLFAKMKNE